MTDLMPPALSSLLAALAALAGLAAPTPAHAKGPRCAVELHGADFTRPIYEAGHWVSARLDVSLSELYVHTPMERGTARWRACLEEWALYTTTSRLAASREDPGRAAGHHRHAVGMWLVRDGDDLVIAGWIDPMQAGGTYVFRSLNDQPISFEVAPNPEADVTPPTPVGVAISYTHRPSPQARIDLELDDASRSRSDLGILGPGRFANVGWLEGTLTLRALGRGQAIELDLKCGLDGRCSARTPDWPNGRYVIDRLWLRDRLENQGDAAGHPLFEGLVIDLSFDSAPIDVGRGTLAPEDEAPPPEADHPPADSPGEPQAPMIDPVEGGADEPAPIAARPSADGCSATPGPGGGGWMALALLVGGCLRRRTR